MVDPPERPLDPGADTPARAGDRARRLRLGLGGLVAVVLLLLLAAALVSGRRGANSLEAVTASGNVADPQNSSDPLAQLGVTPSAEQKEKGAARKR